MNNIKFREISSDTAKPILIQYAHTLTSVVDDFWEEHLINAKVFEIIFSNISIGHFSVYDNEKITMFMLQYKYLNLSQPIFKKILDEYKIKTAFVATCDELLLSLCLDFHKRIEMQAYFFDGTEKQNVIPANFSRDYLSLINNNELEEINRVTNNFFDFVKMSDLENKTCYVYKLSENEIDLGYGIIVPNKFITDYWACGMVTIEKHRQKGVGRSIQIHLADICRENGKTPISGCGYTNTFSKKTIESAGRYSKTRLLNVIFEEKKDD